MTKKEIKHLLKVTLEGIVIGVIGFALIYFGCLFS